MYYENFDLDNIFTPVKADILGNLLKEAGYDKDKTEFLVDGFRNGFDLGYRGPENVRLKAKNLPLTPGCGSKIELWNKIMKEVKAGRYAGPFRNIPFDNYIQSPIGLVPKDNGKQTRLIFHLSHPRINDPEEQQLSVNANTPKELTKVTYPDFDQAVAMCIQAGPNCYLGKSDFKSAFRHLALKKKYWKFLVMKAQSPLDQKIYYFVDKCLPFGASISCAHFQAVSDGIAYLVTYRTNKRTLNYLDDYFFTALRKLHCDWQMQQFLDICQEISFPVSLEKTFWGQTCMSFLGLLIDSVLQMVLIPRDKLNKALTAILDIKTRKKITLAKLQHTCGVLNFLCKCIPAGRAFTRRLYAAGSGLTKPYHHLPVTQEMKLDLDVWLTFLSKPAVYSRPFVDYKVNTAHEVEFYTDASRNKSLGCGGYYGSSWFVMQWDYDFMDKMEPSIAYLELYGLVVAAVLWLPRMQNSRIQVFCDNQSVIHMVNNNSSKCKNCMVLIRILVLHCLINNTRITAKYVPSKENEFADLLSRLKYKQFLQLSKKLNKKFDKQATKVPVEMNMEDLWIA